ncbi:MAG: heat shock protein Hsp20 [Rhodospirillales bacterium]|nr:heat shock protein Hsp20 [Rhodospirillales bacterium]
MAVRDLIPWGRSHAVARNESTHPFLALHQEMNRVFDDFWREFRPPADASGSFGWPRIEVSETGSELTVEAELPGLDEKDVEVLLNQGTLVIRGEKKSVSEDKSRHLSERFYGRFERQIPLPVDVEEDKTVATFKKGVLNVILPKSREATEKTKRIAIAAE